MISKTTNRERDETMNTKRHTGHIQKTLAAIGLIAVAAGAILIPFNRRRPPSRFAKRRRSAEKKQRFLVTPPNLPPPITRDHATKVIIDLEVVETTRADRRRSGLHVLDLRWGPFPGISLGVREGDLVEFHLRNHETSIVPHNIDLHAVTGPGGRGQGHLYAAGQRVRVQLHRHESWSLRFTICATLPIGMHIANGMYGLILVEPEGGLEPVDHEYYVMQGEFYTQGRVGEKGHQAFSYEKALAENPTYVVFNGAVGSLKGDGALSAKTGETIRLFVGNGGPNLVSSFHVIGEIFDNVYTEAGVGTHAQRADHACPRG